MDRYQSKKLTEAVFLYLNGERVSLVQSTIVALSVESEKDAKALYKAIKVDTKLEQQLFLALRVPKAQQKFYTNAPHLFALLTHLHQDGYGFGHLGHLLAIIDETQYNFYRRLQTAGLFTTALAGIGATAHFQPERALRILAFIISRLPLILLEWLRRTFSLLKNLTFIGAAYGVFRYILFIYNTFYHGFSNLTQKLSALFFRTLAMGLNLGAYGIIFLSAGIPTPLSASLFIAASFVGVIESVARYIVIRYKPAPKDNTIQDRWIMEADLIRENNQRHFAVKEMLLRVFFALAIATIVTVWSFIPGSIFLTLGFMAGIAVLGWIESLAFSKLESKNTIKLQKILHEASEPEASISEHLPIRSIINMPALRPEAEKSTHQHTEAPSSAPLTLSANTSKISTAQQGLFKYQPLERNSEEETAQLVASFS